MPDVLEVLARGQPPGIEDVAIANANGPAPAAAQSHGGGEQRVEHRIQIERRAADDLQHVGGRGLLLAALPASR